AGVDLFVRSVGQHEAAASGVVIKQFRVAAPGDGGLQLPLALFLAELFVEHIEEKVLRDGVVALGVQRPANLAEQQDVVHGGVAEQFLLAQNFRVGKLLAAGGDDRIALLDIQEAEQLGGVHDGQQVVDLKAQIVGQAVNVLAAVLVEQQFQQAGD